MERATRSVDGGFGGGGMRACPHMLDARGAGGSDERTKQN
jgi:hypothetical protein